MDTFIEQIIVKRKDAKDIAIIIALLFGMTIVLLAAILLLPYISPTFSLIIVIGAGFGAWQLLIRRNVEFEYSVTNGDIDIDKIIARRSRKRVVSVAGKKIETIEPYVHAAYASRKFDRTVIAAPSLNDAGLWCFTYRSKKSGHTLVVFQPELRVLEAMKIGLSSLIARDFTKALAAVSVAETDNVQ